MSSEPSDWIAVAVLGPSPGQSRRVDGGVSFEQAGTICAAERRAPGGRRQLLTRSKRSGSTRARWSSSSAGVDSISDAEKLRGAEVQVPRSERVELEPGEYFHSDLIGCEVRDRASGRVIGRVTNFEEYGGPPLLEIDGGRMLIPFVKAICVDIRPDEKLIQVGSPGRARRPSADRMKFHLLTIFPDFFEGPFKYGVVARAAEFGALEMHVHDLRNWTHDLHRTVDDRPFGGGEGMLLKPEPIFDAVETIWPERTPKQKVILLSAQGRKFTQQIARELRRNEELLLICGRYEGVDERVAEHLADEELSIGDYVLSGGELAAAVVVDAVARLLPGVVGQSGIDGQRIVRGAGFWIARNGRGRPSFAAGKRRMCCWAEIMPRSGNGESSRAGKDGAARRPAQTLTEPRRKAVSSRIQTV